MTPDCAIFLCGGEQTIDKARRKLETLARMKEDDCIFVSGEEDERSWDGSADLWKSGAEMETIFKIANLRIASIEM